MKICWNIEISIIQLHYNYYYAIEEKCLFYFVNGPLGLIDFHRFLVYLRNCYRDI